MLDLSFCHAEQHASGYYYNCHSVILQHVHGLFDSEVCGVIVFVLNYFLHVEGSVNEHLVSDGYLVFIFRKGVFYRDADVLVASHNI